MGSSGKLCKWKGYWEAWNTAKEEVAKANEKAHTEFYVRLNTNVGEKGLVLIF